MSDYRTAGANNATSKFKPMSNASLMNMQQVKRSVPLIQHNFGGGLFKDGETTNVETSHKTMLDTEY